MSTGRGVNVDRMRGQQPRIAHFHPPDFIATPTLHRPTSPLSVRFSMASRVRTGSGNVCQSYSPPTVRHKACRQFNAACGPYFIDHSAPRRRVIRNSDRRSQFAPRPRRPNRRDLGPRTALTGRISPMMPICCPMRARCGPDVDQMRAATPRIAHFHPLTFIATRQRIRPRRLLSVRFSMPSGSMSVSVTCPEGKTPYKG